MDEGSEYYHSYGHVLATGGLLDILYIGVKAGVYPSLISVSYTHLDVYKRQLQRRRWPTRCVSWAMKWIWMTKC